jgi:cation:H+ antiporter
VASGRYPLPLPLPIALFVLFAVQFVAGITLPTDVDRPLVVVMSALYLLPALGQLLVHRPSPGTHHPGRAGHAYEHLEEADRVATGQ